MHTQTNVVRSCASQMVRRASGRTGSLNCLLTSSIVARMPSSFSNISDGLLCMPIIDETELSIGPSRPLSVENLVNAVPRT